MKKIHQRRKHIGDDILLGLVNKATVVPLSGDNDFVKLPWGTEALDWGSDGLTEGKWDYYQKRYDFADEVLKILEEHPVPEY